MPERAGLPAPSWSAARYPPSSRRSTTSRLERLAAAGHRLLVITNSARETGEHHLSRAGLGERFERVAGTDESQAHEADPPAYALIQCPASFVHRGSRSIDSRICSAVSVQTNGEVWMADDFNEFGEDLRRDLGMSFGCR